MKILSKKSLALAAVAVASVTGGISNAAQVQFVNPGWVYNNPEANNRVNWVIDINDTANTGKFTVNVSIGAPTAAFNGTGDILGLAFDTTLAGLTLSNLTVLSSTPPGQTFSDFGTNSSSCGSGCNFNGIADDTFDYIFKVGSQGSSGGAVTQVAFTIDNGSSVPLTLATFSRFGIRSQSVGAYPGGGDGSAKDYNASPVPLPAALPMFLSALSGLSLAFRRKTLMARV